MVPINYNFTIGYNGQRGFDGTTHNNKLSIPFVVVVVLVFVVVLVVVVIVMFTLVLMS